MIIVSVDTPISVTSVKSQCLFKRELKSLDSVSLERCVDVLHALFLGVPHEINIKFTYKCNV